MATFRFNFQNEDGDGISKSSETEAVKNNVTRESKALEFPVDFAIHPDVEAEVLILKEIHLSYLKVEHVEKKLKQLAENSDVVSATESNSDLVPSVYEGGLKIWKCAVDLVDFLAETELEFENKRVLELGCGGGLPGIFALLKGSSVDFQDYNEEVLENFTMPNVFLNLKASCIAEMADDASVRKAVLSKCHFFAGDWGELKNILNPSRSQEELYDIILTSETIYNVENHQKLYDLIKAHLQKPSGMVFIAAKIHYFGVGGGTRSFEEMVNQEGQFDISVCKTYTGGLQREILAMKWKH